jgi:hypothetical protein
MREITPIALPAGTAQEAVGVVDEVGESVSGITVDEVGFGSTRSMQSSRVGLQKPAGCPSTRHSI